MMFLRIVFDYAKLSQTPSTTKQKNTKIKARSPNFGILSLFEAFWCIHRGDVETKLRIRERRNKGEKRKDGS